MSESAPGLHVGIIMDGNGRWAEARGLGRIAGHAQGARRVTEIVRACPDLGISHLTLFAFSTENWQRPVAEVDALMRIFKQYIRTKMTALREEGVRVRFIGMRHRVPERLRRLMEELEAVTAQGRRVLLTVALDYGARDEMARAARTLARQVAAGERRPGEVSEASVAEALDTHGLPEPDFVIRTSGEMRVSNFMMWQSVYAEFSFSPVTWPDFTAAHLRAEVAALSARTRRYGDIAAPVAQAKGR